MDQKPDHILVPGPPMDAHGNPLPAQIPPGHPFPLHHGAHGTPGICYGPCCSGMGHDQRGYFPYAHLGSYSDMRPRKRTAYTPEQVEVLEEAYANNPYIDLQGRLELAQRMGLQEPQLKVWFQNRRARERRDDPEGEDRLLDYLTPKNKKVAARRSAVAAKPPVLPESPVSNCGSGSKKLRKYPCTNIPSNIKHDYWTYSFHRKVGRYDLKELAKISARFQEEYQNEAVKKIVKVEPVEKAIKIESETQKVVKSEPRTNPKRATRRSRV